MEAKNNNTEESKATEEVKKTVDTKKEYKSLINPKKKIKIDSVDGRNLVCWEKTDYGSPQPADFTKESKHYVTTAYSNFDVFLSQFGRNYRNDDRWTKEEVNTPKKIIDIWRKFNDPKQKDDCIEEIKDRYADKIHSAVGNAKKPKRDEFIQNIYNKLQKLTMNGTRIHLTDVFYIGE